MSDSTEDQALALLAETARPRRRVRPRVARTLTEAEPFEIATPSGPVAAWRSGEGPAVLLVHGWEDDNSLWTSAIDKFRAWGRPVVALDLPGHGFSAAEDASIDGVGAAVAAVARELGPIEAMIGHSYGCAAIIRALGLGAVTERCVLIATPVPRTRPRRPLDIDGVPADVLEHANALRAENARKTDEDIASRVAGITTPALIIHSLDDENCPFANSETLACLWAGSELWPVDGLGHRLIAQDGDVIEKVIAFVEGAA